MSDPRGAAGESASQAAPGTTQPTTPTGDPAAGTATPDDEAPEALEPVEPGPADDIARTEAPADAGSETGAAADDLRDEDPPTEELPTEELPSEDLTPEELPTEVLPPEEPQTGDLPPEYPQVGDLLPDAGMSEPALDASIHAHVFDDPLPPVADDADTPLFEEIRPRPEPGLDPATGDLAAGAAQAEELSPETPQARSEADLPGAPPPLRGAAGEAPVRHAHVGPPAAPLVGRRGFRTGIGALVVIALLVSSGLAVYLYQSARAWRDHADGYESAARSLGEELATSRTDLAGAQAELAAVRDQLATAHQRITELASEKAQLSDEWELTQQLVDYQERVSDAAGQVALSLDQCVQGQQELIGYLARAAEQADTTTTPPPYDPAQLAQFETDVEALCQAASEANIALQRELAR